MKTENKILVVLLCMVLCFVLYSCSKTDVSQNQDEAPAKVSSETESPEAENIESENNGTHEKAFGNFTMADLTGHNTVSALLENYETVSFNETLSDGSCTREGCYFSYNGYPVSAERWTGNEGFTDYYSFDGYSVMTEEGRYLAEVYVGPEEELEITYDLEYDIVMKFDFGGDYIYDLRETDDCYTFYIGYNGEKSYADTACMVSKYDLSIREITSNRGTDYESTIVFKYNEPVNDYGFSEDWDTHKLRNVTIIYELAINSQVADGFMTVTMPYNVEIKPYGYGDYILWADGERTIEYEYPGDNCDYTVYYTNIPG